GGGGLIVMPALMMTGIPPLAVLATNKLQGCMGTATSTFMMLKKKRIHWKDVRLLMFFAFIGALGGAAFVQTINTDSLRFVIPIVLLGIALYFLFSPVPREHEGEQKISNNQYAGIVVPTIGAYDGM